MTAIDDEVYFTEKFPMRMQLKNLNVVSLEDINVILVSNF